MIGNEKKIYLISLYPSVHVLEGQEDTWGLEVSKGKVGTWGLQVFEGKVSNWGLQVSEEQVGRYLGFTCV